MMKKTIFIAILSLVCLCVTGCSKEKKHVDRSDAKKMFERICKLTSEYTDILANSADSSSWAKATSEYEEKLDKINFSFPPDTDLLLTEGQNDTIHTLMLAYIKARDERIHEILYPVAEVDSLVDGDSIMVSEPIGEVSQEGASRSRGN